MRAISLGVKRMKALDYLTGVMFGLKLYMQFIMKIRCFINVTINGWDAKSSFKTVVDLRFY